MTVRCARSDFRDVNETQAKLDSCHLLAFGRDDQHRDCYPEEGISVIDRRKLGKVLQALSSVRDPLQQSPLARPYSVLLLDALDPKSEGHRNIRPAQ